MFPFFFLDDSIFYDFMTFFFLEWNILIDPYFRDLPKVCVCGTEGWDVTPTIIPVISNTCFDKKKVQTIRFCTVIRPL